MRTIFILLISLCAITAEAQTPLAQGLFRYNVMMPLGNNIFSGDNSLNKKWFFSTYTGVSTSGYFFNGNNAMIVSTPVGLQLNRVLNKNWYAFAGVSVAPAYGSFSHAFLSSDANKMYPGNNFYNTNHFGYYSRAELGVMYVNDEKTFSISGSIGVERSSYPVVPYPATQNRVTPSNR